MVYMVVVQHMDLLFSEHLITGFTSLLFSFLVIINLDALILLKRLAKRWVAAHLFSALFAEEAIELVVAHLFVKPFPFSSPCSRIAGFLRFGFLV